MGASAPPSHQIGDLPAAGTGGVKGLRQRLRDRLRLRLRRQIWIIRAIRKRRELKQLLVNRTALRKARILCVLVVRNEMHRLAHFIGHYRALGVDHFLIVDNNSTDSTFRFLTDLSDVSVWSTAGSYKASRFGLDWTNWLLLRHGHGRWCLTVDADELLVYPNWETRPLPALTRWLDSCGRDSFGALMLDMYPEGRLSDARIPPAGDPLSVLQWFDGGNYSVQVQPRMRNLWIQGGPRARAFFGDDPRRAPTLNKVPLVKWNWRYAYHNSTHSILPARLNAVFDENGGEMTSGALLHTKFLHTIVEKSAEEKSRRQHFADPDRFGSYYDGLIADPVLRTPFSRRYTGWRQLEALGLISRGGWV